MTFNTITLPFGLLLLGACAAEIVEPVATLPSPTEQMFNSAVAMAGANQNAQTARLRADDNCFWYRHVEPVETTELPLLTPWGEYICGPAEVVTPVDPAV